MSRTRLLGLRTRALVVGVLIGAGSAGMVWASVSESADPGSPTGYTAQRSRIPQASSEDDAVQQTMAGLDKSYFVSVGLGASPSTVDKVGRWFYAVVQDPAGSKAPLPRGVWEADLAQGAIADRLAGGEPDLADVIVGSSIQSRDPSYEGGGAGDIVAGQLFAADGESDEAIEASVDEALAKFGAEPEEVDVLHPLGPAVYVRASVPTPEAMISFDELRTAIMGPAETSRYEGLYLEVDTPRTGPLVIGSVALRTGAGRVWVADGYLDKVGVLTGGLPGRG